MRLAGLHMNQAKKHAQAATKRANDDYVKMMKCCF